MTSDFILYVWLPGSVVLAGLYAFFFRLPAILIGKAREEHFLFGWIGMLAWLILAGMVVSLVTMELGSIVLLAIAGLFLFAFIYALAMPVIMISCGFSGREYQQLIDEYPMSATAAAVRHGIIKANEYLDRDRVR